MKKDIQFLIIVILLAYIAELWLLSIFATGMAAGIVIRDILRKIFCKEECGADKK